MAKENKLYVFIELKKNYAVEYFFQNKISNYRIALNGKLCNIGKIEPYDQNLVKIRQTVQFPLEFQENNGNNNLIVLIISKCDRNSET